MKRILSVAEKPSTAKRIADILSLGTAKTVASMSKFNPNYQFDYKFREQEVSMLFTSVTGHLIGLAFEEQYSIKNWLTQPQEHLFKTAKICKQVNPEYEDRVKNLQSLATDSATVILWLDCDSEGETIAFEVLEICRKVNLEIEVFRAHFSALTESEIENAMNSLREPNRYLADAIDARQEVDFRTGSAFTRYQTILLKKNIPALSNIPIIVFGFCLLPTLGFVVERWKRVNQFIPKPFYFIHCRTSNLSQSEFRWDRHILYDKDLATTLYKECSENPIATVLSITCTEARRRTPYPLSTSSLLKLVTSKLRLASYIVMAVAEKLYNRGYISYPRTETDHFTHAIDLKALIAVQKDHPLWGQYAHNLLDDEGFQWPKSGEHDDKAHPPIHPLKMAIKDSGELTWDEWRVYELITRRFLACCSKDAIGSKTIITIGISNETFQAQGLVIEEYNWLEVYPYERWHPQSVPDFEVNEKFTPTVLQFKESMTSGPELLTEQELILLMDNSGIGTDATVQEHIKVIQDRQCAEKQNQYLIPTKLGVALVEAHEAAGTELWKPLIRSMMETNIREIAKGVLNKEVFLAACLDEMETIFKQLKQREGTFLDVMRSYYEEATSSGHANLNTNINSWSTSKVYKP